MEKNKRTQVLLTEKQHRKLLELSKKRKKSIGYLIREAIDNVYITAKKNKEKIIRDIASMNLPAEEWGKVKKDIIKGKSKQ
jgi:hypothetical protein